MSTPKCLYCYQSIGDDVTQEFHPECSKKIFDSPIAPVLNYTNDQMLELAEQVIKSQSTVTGVQPKLSLGLSKLSQKDFPQKLTIMGLWGNYILKPPSQHYPQLPEIEDLTMHLAQLAEISTVSHTLIRLKSGELSYLTKRIDRQGKHKRHMEDMCQLTERLTEAKYRGSYEQIGKAILRFSVNPGLDLITFFEQVVFSFLTGNNDMHLKNFSLFKHPQAGYSLSPAYDMVASKLVLPEDDEELALTLNGKKKKLKATDFQTAMERFISNTKARENILHRFKEVIPKWHTFIDQSFLDITMRQDYHDLIDQRGQQIGIC
jgi:serine/threonine-protein kinase HipA